MSQTHTYLIELNGVTVRHHAAAAGAPPALRELSVAIAAGEQVAVIGSSGAGKTTLLHLLGCVLRPGALRPDAGEFKLFGSDPWLLSNAARHTLRSCLFLAPQTPPLPPRQRVITTVLAGRLPQWSLWQAISSLIKPSDPDAAYQALARFNLQDKLYERVDRLSGGERQRCGMARLLLSNAKLLLVDEPLSALDPTLSRQTLTTLLQEATARGATLICSLHHVEFARAYFPRIIGLREGRIMFDVRREKVTDAMVAALYQNEQQAVPVRVFEPLPNIGQISF